MHGLGISQIVWDWVIILTVGMASFWGVIFHLLNNFFGWLKSHGFYCYFFCFCYLELLIVCLFYFFFLLVAKIGCLWFVRSGVLRALLAWPLYTSQCLGVLKPLDGSLSKFFFPTRSHTVAASSVVNSGAFHLG